MERIHVGKTSDFQQQGRLIVSVADHEIGVLLHGGRYYAYENRCLHQGGPVCEGLILGKVEQILAPDKRVVGERFSEDEIHIVCPWHGWEYDIRTGECAADRSLRLRSYRVEQDGDDVYVWVGE